MKNLVLAISLLFLVGCGGSSSSSNTQEDKTKIKVSKISNKGLTHNQYGYYGDNVIFGNTTIQRGWLLYGINPDGTLHNIPNEQRYNNDEFSGKYKSQWTTLGTYGVSEDGKILTTHYDLFNNNETYTYVEDISVKDKFTNVQKVCMKVKSSFKDIEYYAFCK